MAIYRQVQMSFWTDTKVMEDFTAEDRYFYLYLFTNPHTNLCGCYQVGIKQMAIETGLNEKTVRNVIKRLSEIHKVIVYSEETKEVIIVNWRKYNWTASEKFRKPLAKEIENIKNPEFKAFLEDLYNGIDTVSIPYPYGMDTTVTVTVTDTVTVSDTDTVSVKDKDPVKAKQDPLSTSSMSDSLKEKTQEWLQYKKERRENYHPTGKKTLIKQLEKAEATYGTRAVVDAIDTAMASGWMGIGIDRIKKPPDDAPSDEWERAHKPMTEEERKLYASLI